MGALVASVCVLNVDDQLMRAAQREAEVGAQDGVLQRYLFETLFVASTFGGCATESRVSHLFGIPTSMSDFLTPGCVPATDVTDVTDVLARAQ